MATTKQLKRNIPLLYVFSFFWLSMVILPVIVPFFESRGLDLAQVFFLQSIFAAFVVLGEVPSGYIADLYGRRQALFLGSVFHALAYTWLVFADGFMALVLFELLAAIGLSLLSGADLSLLYDSQDALGQSQRERTRGIANLRFVKSMAEGVSALIGGVLIWFSMEITVIANALFAWVPLVLALFLVEAPFQRMDAGAPVANLKEVVTHLLFRDRLLRLTCINITFFSLATFYVVWLLQPYWGEEGAPLTLFGLLWAAQCFLFAITSKLAPVLEERLGPRVVLLMMGLLPVAGYLGMAQFGGAIGILLSFTFFVSRGFNQVILTDALNRRVPSKFRATANSMTSFAFRGVYIVTGPVIGIAVTTWGMQATLMMLGVVSVVLVVTCLLPLIAAIDGAQPGTAEQGVVTSRE